MAKLRKIHKILEALLDRASQYPTDSICLRAHSLLYAAIDAHLIQKRIHSPQDFPDVFHKPAKAVHRNWCLTKWGKIDPTFTRSYIAEPSPQDTLLQYLYHSRYENSCMSPLS
jgi:hypothetical protein